MDERCEHAARSNSWARASKLWKMKSGNGTIVRCTKPRQEVPDSEGEGGLRALEKSCSETGAPKSGEPKQLDQTRVLVKHA